MIAKGNLLNVNGISAAIVGFILLLSACDNASDILNSTDTQNVNSEAVSSVYSNESSDISSDLIASLTFSQYAGARTESETISSKDDRTKCKETSITLIRTGTKLSPRGIILIDFGSGCTDSKGVTRKGQIYIKYSGRRWTPGSYFKDSLVNYYRNDTHIEGVLTVTVQLSADTAHLQFQSVLANGKITFADGKTISRSHTITRQWNRALLPLNDQWITLAGSSASGTNKKGVEYEMVVTKDMVEKVSCLSSKIFIPVSGEKIISTENKEYSIDYGDGSCDNDVTVTLNGKTKNISVNADGN